MNGWILIFFMATSFGYSGGPATAEFRDRDRCEEAAKVVRDWAKGKDSRGAFAVCVPK